MYCKQSSDYCIKWYCISSIFGCNIYRPCQGTTPFYEGACPTDLAPRYYFVALTKC